MATIEERVSALEALAGTESRVQARQVVGLSHVRRELTALGLMMQAFSVKQDLVVDRIGEIEAWQESADERFASIDARLVTIIEMLQRAEK